MKKCNNIRQNNNKMINLAKMMKINWSKSMRLVKIILMLVIFPTWKSNKREMISKLVRTMNSMKEV